MEDPCGRVKEVVVRGVFVEWVFQFQPKEISEWVVVMVEEECGRKG